MSTTDANADASAVQTRPTRTRAVTQAGYGRPETLTTTRVDVPTPGASQVLVEVAAAGVDRGVWHVVTGAFPSVVIEPDATYEWRAVAELTTRWVHPATPVA